MIDTTKDRNKYIGGSDMPAILGIDKFNKNILTFAKEKAGLIKRSFDSNQYTKYGQYMEPIIRDYINDTYNAEYKEDTKIRGYLRANTDGFDSGQDIPLIEIKTHGKSGLDIDYYEPQCQFYMELFDADKCQLIGYERPEDFYRGLDINFNKEDFNLEFDPNKLTIVTIFRDREKWNRYLYCIDKFKTLLDDLEQGTPDDVAIEEFRGQAVTSEINKVNSIYDDYLKAEEMINYFKQVKENLYEVMEAEGLKSVDTEKFKITLVAPTENTKETLNEKELKKEYPELFEKYKEIKITKRKGYIKITDRR